MFRVDKVCLVGLESFLAEYIDQSDLPFFSVGFLYFYGIKNVVQVFTIEK